MPDIYDGSVNLSNRVDHFVPFYIEGDARPRITLYFFGSEFAKESFVYGHRHTSDAHGHDFSFAGWSGDGGPNPGPYLRVDNRREGHYDRATTFHGEDTTVTRSVRPTPVTTDRNTNERRGFLNQMRVWVDGIDKTEVIEGYLHTAPGGGWSADDLGNGTPDHPINSSDGLSGGTKNGIPFSIPGMDFDFANARHCLRFAHPVEGGGRLNYVLRIVYA